MIEATSQPLRMEFEGSFAPLRSDLWGRWLAPLISVAVLLVSVAELRGMDVRGLTAMLPASPAFWLVFAGYYLFAPATEWLIFRRLWSLPRRGFLALLRKRVSNEILLGYSGEIYFYGWARRNMALTGTPFGAVKDVAILSAAVGNAATLALLAVSWPLIGALRLGMSGELLAISIGTIALSSLGALLFRRTLNSVPAAELRYITLLHSLRIVVTTVLAALLWHMVMPGAPLVWWLLLSTLRLLVSRLPFVPNKDVVFAGIATFLIGRTAEVSELLTMMAALTLATHVLLGSALSVGELVGAERDR